MSFRLLGKICLTLSRWGRRLALLAGLGQVLEQGTLWVNSNLLALAGKSTIHSHLDVPTYRYSSVAQNQGVAILGNQVHMDFASGKCQQELRHRIEVWRPPPSALGQEDWYK